jgi:hypothetical protein
MNIIKKFKEIVYPPKKLEEIYYPHFFELWHYRPQYLNCKILRNGNLIVARFWNDQVRPIILNPNPYVIDYNAVRVDSNKEYVDIYMSLHTARGGMAPRITLRSELQEHDTLIKIRYSLINGESDIISCSELISEDDIMQMKASIEQVMYRDSSLTMRKALIMNLGEKFSPSYWRPLSI